MKERVLFLSPAKLYSVDDNGDPLQPLRENVSLPALTVLGSLRSEFDVDFIDMAADGYENRNQYDRNIYRFGLSNESILDRINDTSPSALLITSMFTSEHSLIDDLTNVVKRRYPKLPIVVGGIHASIRPEWILDSGNIDYVVLGEGEETAINLLKSINGGKEDPETIKGIAYRRGGKTEITHPRPLIEDIDREFAFDEVLWDNGEYRYTEQRSRRSGLYQHLTKPDWERDFSLYYSRGCPIHCDYCPTTERNGSKIRHAGSRRMFFDLKSLHEKSKVQIFYNQSDTFGFHPDDIEFLRMVKEYRKEHPDFVLNNPNAFFVNLFFPRHNRYELDEQMIDLLADSGLNVVTVAVETFNQRYNKKIDFSRIQPEKIGELFSAIRGRGMKSESYMIYGFPEQTKQEIISDESIADSMSSDEVSWFRCNIFPGSKFYREGIRKGWFTEKTYRETIKGSSFQAFPENYTHITDSELSDFTKRHLSSR